MVSISNIGREIPELETNRLRLRGHRLEDFEDCFALWSDPDVVRYIGGKPLGRKSVWDECFGTRAVVLE
jgi:RimJ/RimL family protein N-acetyltransferase